MAFHVLKWFSQINPDTGAGNVQIVSHLCQISENDACTCIEELRRLNFIKIVGIAVTEGEGHYKITPEGRDYVFANAT